MFRNTPWLNNKQKENPLVIINNILIDASTASEIVEIPDNVIAIADYAFEGSAASAIYVSESVKSIGKNAFLDCNRLRTLYIPKTVSNISNVLGLSFLNKLYYEGTPTDLKAVYDGLDNNIAYYSALEPEDNDNLYWHYVDNEITIWE